MHRFAIEYNRKLGGKKVRGSTLDKIPGVGDKRRADLLKHFGSIENIKRADEQELARVVRATLRRRFTTISTRRTEACAWYPVRRGL